MNESISYEPFERLIVSLRNDGRLKESGFLDYMIHKAGWTTGSELVGELGEIIDKMMKENILGLSDESKNNMREAMKMVKRIWPDFPE